MSRALVTLHMELELATHVNDVESFVEERLERLISKRPLGPEMQIVEHKIDVQE